MKTFNENDSKCKPRKMAWTWRVKRRSAWRSESSGNITNNFIKSAKLIKSKRAKCDQIVRSCTSCATAGPCTFPFERAAAKQPGWMLHSSPAAPNERTLRHANEAEAMQQFALKKHWISLDGSSQLSMATF